MDIIDELARIGKDLMLEEPFYGIFLSTLNKKILDDDRACPTAGVSKIGLNFELTVNPKFWNSLPRGQKLGVLKHELLHITQFHLFLRQSFGDYLLFNIAADMSINQYIKDEWKDDNWIKLPKGYEAFKGTQYYYQKLQEDKDKNGGMPDGLQDIYDAMSNGFKVVCSHDLWDQFKDLSEAEKKLIEKQLEYQLKEVEQSMKKSKGTIPSELSELFKRLAEQTEPVISWAEYFRRFTGGSNKIYTKKLRRKFNKRFDESPGLKIKQKRHILVAIDTSGSVSSQELQEFFGEVHHMWKTGCQITVIQCDAAVHSVQEYKGKDIMIKGRGGTDFQPVIDYYNEHARLYTTLVYLTDGECPAPSKPYKKMMWVISKNGTMGGDLPYFKIKMN